MGEDITLAALDQAEAQLAQAKAARQDGGDEAVYRAVADEVTQLRRAYRDQEIAAGRRGAGVGVGGDAVRST